MSWQERIVNDGTDRESWLVARHPSVGASDAAKLAKPTSVPLYLAAKLDRGSFTGNTFTDSGNRWEPMMLAWAGIPGNKALIHAPGEPGFTATPDGLTADGKRGAECKAKHNKIVTGPSLGEWRQLAWQFHCIPELETIEFIWVELIDGEIRPGRDGEPSSLVIPRDHPKIVELTALILPIATDLLARLTVALEFERTLTP